MTHATTLPCPICSGTGTDTHEDRHAGTNQDTCRSCGGTGTIPARTGESAEASFQINRAAEALSLQGAEVVGLREALGNLRTKMRERDDLTEKAERGEAWWGHANEAAMAVDLAESAVVAAALAAQPAPAGDARLREGCATCGGSGVDPTRLLLSCPPKPAPCLDCATLAPPADPKTPDAGVGVRPTILEASEPFPTVAADYALTCRWADGTETVELVSGKAAALLGHDDSCPEDTLAQPAPAGDDEPEKCFACEVAFKPGDMVIQDITEGTMHRDCCGPERDSFVGEDGEPLKDGEPIPAGYPWRPEGSKVSAGDDETGVRAPVDALGDFVGSSVTIRDVLTRDAMRTVPSDLACEAVDAYIAALSTAPATRPGGGVEEWLPISAARQEELVVLGWWQFSTLGFPPRWSAEVGRASCVGSATHFRPLPAPPELAAAPAADGGVA